MNQKYLQILQNIGLSENQVRIYLSLVEIGVASMTELSKRAGLKRPTSYLAVEELEYLGIISKTKQGKRYVYSAVHPRRLLQLLNNRKKDFEGIYDKIEVAYNRAKARPTVKVFEGIEAVRELYDRAFTKIAEGAEGLLVGNIGSVTEKYADHSQDYINHLLRIERPRVREVIYDTPESRAWVAEVKKRSTSETHQIRLIDQSFPFGNTDYMLVGDTTYMFSMGSEIFITVIESKEITKTQRALFEWVWLSAKEFDK